MKSVLRIETKVKSLKNYIDEFEKGAFQIPSFQRDFLWKVEDVLQLFDSIKNSYPIGSIQFWQPDEYGDVWINNDAHIGPYQIIEQSTDPKPVFVLDGYQRLSSLFGCLVNPKKYNTNKLRLNQEKLEDNFSVYYDLENEEFTTIRKRSKPTSLQIPLYVLMSSSDFRKYARENIETIENQDKIDVYLDRADQLANTLNEYQIASVDITNASIEEAIKIFWLVNARGLELTKDWIVNALTNTKGFRLQTSLDTLIEDLRIYNFNGVKRDLLFNCIQSSFGKLYYDTKIEELVKEPTYNFIEVAKKSISSIESAIKFMFNELHIIHHKLLPSNWQLIFIVEFFNIVDNPEEKYDLIKNWFWFTVYSNYFTVYNPSKRSRAFTQFRNYFLGDEEELIYNDDPNVKFTAVTYKYTNFGSVRFSANVLFQLKNSIISSESCLGFDWVKLFHDQKESLENIIYLPTFINGNDLTFNNQKHKDFSFTLNQDYKGRFSEYYITEDMRNEYAQGNINRVLEIRKNIILNSEKIFVENLDIEYL